MKIAFDVDGVVLNSIEIILDHMAMATGKTFSPHTLVSWELEELGVDAATIWSAIDHLFSLPKVEPYDGAVESLSRIYHAIGEPLVFITGRGDPGTARRQMEALHWPSGMPEMIVTGGDRDKRPYIAREGIDFLIEDDPYYVKEYLEAGIGVGLMLRPWNRQAPVSVTRAFHGWADLEQWFFNNNGNRLR